MMETKATTADVVELGDALEMTLGTLPVGIPDSNGTLNHVAEGITESD